ncbi:MAG: hypothetical protein H0T83_09040 [Chthoniobacterales bacterium]|nr:hypothetical protein [Chthoniobacterales bacterium]
MNRFVLVLIALLSWPLLAPAQSPRVGDLYARGLAGDKEAVSECIRLLEEILVTKPDDQLARVYLGSAYTLRARDRSFGKSKLDALHKGVALMDEAAAAAPKNANVLLTRAVTNEALPVFLGRRKAARAQLEELVAQVEKDPAALKPADKQLLYLNAGQAAQHAGDKKRATELWQRGLGIVADAKLTAEIKAALAQH